MRAIDASELALRNAIAAWPTTGAINWELADVRTLRFPPGAYDIVLAYGLLHCFANESEVRRVVAMLQRTTTAGGFNVVCVFNSRRQDLRAHPHFNPVLLDHDDYVHLYADWRLLCVTDSDLDEAHPHNGIRHVHSMTRLIARKP